MAAEIVTIKIHRSTHALLTEVLNRLARGGWASLGLTSDEPPTYGAVVDAAVKHLLAVNTDAARASKKR